MEHQLFNKDHHLFNKILMSKRLNLKNKDNGFFKEIPSSDKLTFREKEDATSNGNKDNKENNPDFINQTIKIKEKTYSNMCQLFQNNSSQERLEKSTPGFNKHQKKLDHQDLRINEKSIPSPSENVVSVDRKENEPRAPSNPNNRMKKNKKTSSCLWESSNYSFDVAHNISIDSHKDVPLMKLVENSNNSFNNNNNFNVLSNMGRKLKLPTNHFWKKFIGKNLNTTPDLANKTNFKKEKSEFHKNNHESFTQNSKTYNEFEWLKNEIFALKEKVSALENSEKVLKEKTEKLDKKYKKLKKEKQNLKKVNNYLVEQNKGILADLKDFPSKSSNNNFETVLKSLNEFEVKLKNSIICSNKLIISQD